MQLPNQAVRNELAWNMLASQYTTQAHTHTHMYNTYNTHNTHNTHTTQVHTMKRGVGLEGGGEQTAAYTATPGLKLKGAIRAQCASFGPLYVSVWKSASGCDGVTLTVTLTASAACAGPALLLVAAVGPFGSAPASTAQRPCW